MPTPSPHYTYGQLEGLWISQGGPAHLAPLMAAIAEAESGGNARARNRSGASGLWQILGAPTGWTGSTDWFDPENNARAAVAKWKTGGLKQWVTWTTGAYRRYLRHGVAPVMPGGTASPIPYANPLRGIKGLTAERVDMGVDYSGSGPIYAIGPGRITNVYNAGWPGGVFIGERLSAGPLRGRYVYAAEDITPSVRVGQKVTAATQIGTVHGGIETGLAAPPGIGDALGASQFSGANPTAFGAAYSKILQDLGAPAGTMVAGSAVGSTPSWLQRIVGDIGGAVSGIGGTVSGIGGIGNAVGRIATVFEDAATAVDWLIQPQNWVRIIAGVGGAVLVLGGMWTLTHVGGEAGGLRAPRPVALPVGILEVGGGGILLFVAFHNLPGSPSNIGELLGSLRDQARATASGQQAVAA